MPRQAGNKAFINMQLSQPLKNFIFGYLGSHPLDPSLYINAVKPAQLLSAILERAGKPVPPALRALKQQDSPGARLYNWNLLGDPLSKLGVELSSFKNQIVAGEVSKVAELLKAIMQASQKESRLSPGCSEEELVSYVKQKLRRCLEVTKEQAVTLLQQDNKYFSHLVVKGIKGEFRLVQRLYQGLVEECTDICEAVRGQKVQTEFVIQLVKAGMLSKSQEVAERTISFLGLYFDCLKQELNSDWLGKEPVNLMLTICLSARRHPQHGQMLSRLVQQLFVKDKHNLLQLVSSALSEEEQQVYFFKSTYPYLRGLLSQDNKGVLYEMLNNTEPFDLASLKVMFLIIGEGVEEEFGVSAKFKRTVAKLKVSQQISAADALFQLLGQTAQRKSPLSGEVFKQICTLFQNAAEPYLNQFILLNLTSFMKANPTLPPEPILQPLLKHLNAKSDSEDIILQLSFLTLALAHPRTRKSTCAQVLDQLAKLFMGSKIWKQSCYGMITLHVEENRTSGEIQQFLKRLLKFSLAVLMNQTQKKKDKLLLNKEKWIVKLLSALVVHSSNVQNTAELIVHAYYEVKRTGKNAKDFITVLAKLGDPESFLAKFSTPQEPMSAIKSEAKRSEPAPHSNYLPGKIVIGGKGKEPKKLELPAINSSLPLRVARNMSHLSGRERYDQEIPMSSKMEFEERVQNHLKRLKLENQYRVLNEESLKERKLKAESIRRERLAAQVQRRKVILCATKQKDINYNPEIQFDKGKSLNSNMFTPLPADMVQDSDAEQIALVQKKYANALGLIFNGLAKVSKREDDKVQAIDLVWLHTFVKNNKVAINREQLYELVRFSVGGEFASRVNYQQFLTVLLQLAVYINFRQPAAHDISQSLQGLILRVCESESIKIQTQSEKEKQLAAKSKSSNEFQLPKGYVRVTAVEIKSEAVFSPTLRGLVENSYLDCLEIVADLVKGMLVEPVMRKDNVIKVKQVKSKDEDIKQKEKQKELKKPLVFQKADAKKEEQVKAERSRLMSMRKDVAKRKEQLSEQLKMLAQKKKQKQDKQKEAKQKEIQEKQKAAQREAEAERKQLQNKKKMIDQFHKKKEEEKKKQQEKKKQELKRLQAMADQNVKKNNVKHEKDIEISKEAAKQKLEEAKKRQEQAKHTYQKAKLKASETVKKAKQQTLQNEKHVSQLKEWLKDSELRSQLNKHDEQLRQLFKEYIAKYGKFSLDKKSDQIMQYSSFKTLATNTKIVSQLLSVQEMLTLYKQVAIQEDKMDGLTFGEFQLLLVRISDKAKDKLAKLQQQDPGEEDLQRQEAKALTQLLARVLKGRKKRAKGRSRVEQSKQQQKEQKGEQQPDQQQAGDQQQSD